MSQLVAFLGLLIGASVTVIAVTVGADLLWHLIADTDR